MIRYLRTLLLGIFVLIGLTTTSVYAGPYSALYVFGDSLSDVGNDYLITGGAIPLSPPYSNGRFTNGPTYAEVLASGLGLSPLTASLAGGTDYAYGGARSNYVAAGLPSTALGSPNPALSFVEQVGAYVAVGPADPDALYLLWIGANDLSDVLTGDHPILVGGGTPSDAIANTLGDLAGSIATLASIGAQHFLIPNLPNLGLTPAVLGLNIPAASQSATFLTGIYNAALDTMLDNFPSLNLFRYDTFSAHTAIFNNPGAYGLTNVTDSCWPGDVTGGPAGASACTNPNNYLYWDYEHPSTTTHAILGGQMLALVVPEPSQWALFLIGLSVLGWRLKRQAHGGNHRYLASD